MLASSKSAVQVDRQVERCGQTARPLAEPPAHNGRGSLAEGARMERTTLLHQSWPQMDALRRTLSDMRRLYARSGPRGGFTYIVQACHQLNQVLWNVTQLDELASTEEHLEQILDVQPKTEQLPHRGERGVSTREGGEATSMDNGAKDKRVTVPPMEPDAEKPLKDQHEEKELTTQTESPAQGQLERKSGTSHAHCTKQQQQHQQQQPQLNQERPQDGNNERGTLTRSGDDANKDKCGQSPNSDGSVKRRKRLLVPFSSAEGNKKQPNETIVERGVDKLDKQQTTKNLSEQSDTARDADSSEVSKRPSQQARPSYTKAVKLTPKQADPSDQVVNPGLPDAALAKNTDQDDQEEGELKRRNRRGQTVGRSSANTDQMKQADIAAGTNRLDHAQAARHVGADLQGKAAVAQPKTSEATTLHEVSPEHGDPTGGATTEPEILVRSDSFVSSPDVATSYTNKESLCGDQLGSRQSRQDDKCPMPDEGTMANDIAGNEEQEASGVDDESTHSGSPDPIEETSAKSSADPSLSDPSTDDPASELSKLSLSQDLKSVVVLSSSEHLGIPVPPKDPASLEERRRHAGSQHGCGDAKTSSDTSHKEPGDSKEETTNEELAEMPGNGDDPLMRGEDTELTSDVSKETGKLQGKLQPPEKTSAPHPSSSKQTNNNCSKKRKNGRQRRRAKK